MTVARQRSVRTIVKHAAERALLAAGVARFGRRRRRGEVLVLAYHNIVPEGSRAGGEASLHLAQGEFERQLDLIGRTHDVVSLASLAERRPGSGRPRVVITFDDAYLGAVEVGVRALTDRAMPATIFVAPGLLGGGTWWDALADACGGVVPPAVRAQALSELAGDGAAILRRFGPDDRKAPTDRWMRIATESELSHVSRASGITFGSHTWSHANLRALPADALRLELERPLAWLRAKFCNVLPWLSYPYGLYSDAVAAAAESMGYAGALRVEGGWARSWESRPWAVPRFNVPAGLSPEGFALRLGGWGAR